MSHHRKVTILTPVEELKEEKLVEANKSMLSARSTKSTKSKRSVRSAKSNRSHVVAQVPMQRKPTVRAEDRATTRPAGLRTVINDWELMLLAKHHPGRFDAPYVTDMNQSSAHTGIVSTSWSQANVWDIKTPAATDPKVLGAFGYTVILQCSSLTAFYGPGGTGYMESGVKLGGMIIAGVNNPTDKVFTAAHFAQSPNYWHSAHSMAAIWGSSGTTVAEQAFIWAQRSRFILEAPAATRSGVIKIGACTLASMGLISEYTTSNGLSVNDLLKSVTHTIDLKNGRTGFTLDTAVVSHSLANHSWCRFAGDEHEVMGGEVVRFAIIENAFQNITTGAFIPYMMSVQVQANYAFVPKVWDAFTRNTGESGSIFDDDEFNGSVYGHKHGRGPVMLPIIKQTTRHQYNPQYIAPQSFPTIRKALAHMMDFYKSNRTWIDPLAATVAKLATGLLMDGKGARRINLPKCDGIGSPIDRANAAAQLRQAIEALRYLPSLHDRYNFQVMQEDYRHIEESPQFCLDVQSLQNVAFLADLVHSDEEEEPTTKGQPAKKKR